MHLNCRSPSLFTSFRAARGRCISPALPPVLPTPRGCWRQTQTGRPPRAACFRNFSALLRCRGKIHVLPRSFCHLLPLHNPSSNHLYACLGCPQRCACARGLHRAPLPTSRPGQVLFISSLLDSDVPSSQVGLINSALGIYATICARRVAIN